MTKKKRVSKLTLRLQEENHQRLIKVSRDLDITVNATVNLLVSRWLGRLALEAQMYKVLAGNVDTVDNHMYHWLAEVEGRTRAQFVGEFLKLMMGEPSTIRSNTDWQRITAVEQALMVENGRGDYF